MLYHALNRVLRLFHSYTRISSTFCKINYDGQSRQVFSYIIIDSIPKISHESTCRSLFLNKVADLLLTNLFLKVSCTNVFLWIFSCQIFHGTFFSKHLLATASTKCHFVRWFELRPKMLLSTCFFSDLL